MAVLLNRDSSLFENKNIYEIWHVYERVIYLLYENVNEITTWYRWSSMTSLNWYKRLPKKYIMTLSLIPQSVHWLNQDYYQRWYGFVGNLLNCFFFTKHQGWFLQGRAFFFFKTIKRAFLWLRWLVIFWI